MPPAGSGPRLRHDALFYETEEEIAAAAVGFVRDGVQSGETVLVNTVTLPVTALLRAVFGDEPLVHFAGSPVYSKPVSILDRYQRLLEKAIDEGSPGMRAMGHIDPVTGPLPWQEWVRYEAAVNTALAGYPFQTLCPYDLRLLDPAVLRGMRAAHPTFVRHGERVPADEYLAPRDLAALPEYAAGPDPLQATEPVLVLDEPADWRSLRLDLYPAVLPVPLPRRKVDDFVKAVVEVAGNAIDHGVGPVRLRLWTAPDRLVATVTDRGPGIADPLAGYCRPPRPRGAAASGATGEPGGGLGLWAARQLCDVLDYGSTEDGFTVRLVTFDG